MLFVIAHKLQIITFFFKKNPEDEINLSVPLYTPLSGSLSHCSSLNVSEQVLHPCKEMHTFTIICVPNFVILNGRRDEKIR